MRTQLLLFDRSIVWYALLFTACCLCIECSGNAGLENETDFKIPSAFEVIHHDKNNDEILAVKYKNEMQIIVSENMSNIIKKGALYGSSIMKQSYEVKFPSLVKQQNGFNVSEQAYYYVGKNIYLHQSFEYDSDGIEGYFEYGAMHIEDPEEYYEFYISGDKLKKDNHKSMIKSFLDGVK